MKIFALSVVFLFHLAVTFAQEDYYGCPSGPDCDYVRYDDCAYASLDCTQNLDAENEDDHQAICDCIASEKACLIAACPCLPGQSSFQERAKLLEDTFCPAEEEEDNTVVIAGGAVVVGGVGAGFAVSAHNAKIKKLKLPTPTPTGQEMQPMQPSPSSSPFNNPLPNTGPQPPGGAAAQPSYIQPLQADPTMYAQNQAMNAAQQQMNYSQQKDQMFTYVMGGSALISGSNSSGLTMPFVQSSPSPSPSPEQYQTHVVYARRYSITSNPYNV